MPHRVRIPSDITTPFGAAAEGLASSVNTAREFELAEQQRKLKERRLRLEELGIGLDLAEQRREARTDRRINESLGNILGGGQEQPQASEQPQGGGQQGVPQTPATAADSGSQSRLQGLNMVQTINQLARTPKSVRGPQVDAFVAQFQQRTGRRVAPNVIETLKKGNTQDLSLIGRGLAQRATQDESFDANKAVQILSDPQASAQVLTEIGAQAGQMQEADQAQQQTEPQAVPFAAPQQQQAQRQPLSEQGQQQPETPALGQRVAQIDQQIQRLRRVEAELPLSQSQRSRVEAARNQLEARRNSALERAEANVLRQTRQMPESQALERLKQFEATLIESGAPQEQINRIQDRIDAFGGDEGDGVAFGEQARRLATGMFGRDRVIDDNGNFTTANLSQDEVQKLNDRIQRLGIQREQAAAEATARLKAWSQAAKRADELFATQRLIGELAAGPEGSVGIRRLLANLTGSTIGQVPGLEGMANSVTSFFTGGLDQQELSALNTEFRALVGQVAGTFTGDSGGRLSNQDLERVDRAIPAQDAWTTKDQVMGSLKELASLQELAFWKQKFRAGEDLDFDPSSKESVKSKIREYQRRFNMSATEAGELVDDVITISDIHGNL